MIVTSRKINGKSFRTINHDSHGKSIRVESYLVDGAGFDISFRLSGRDYRAVMNRKEVQDLVDSLTKALKGTQ